MVAFRNILKKVIPDTWVDMARAAQGGVGIAMARRARKIGLQGNALRSFLKNPDGALNLKQLNLFGAPKKVSFLRESKAFIIESVLEDAYQLETLPLPKDRHIKIIDIGANVGTFAIAARNEFPLATIHCYEPNPFLKSYILNQGYAVNAKVFMEGVGLENGFFSFDQQQNEILQSESVSIMNFQEKGVIPVVSLKKAIERIGGSVDLLKMDCEGSEWAILKDRDILQHVSCLTFEYHRLSPDKAFDIFDRSLDIQKMAIAKAQEAGFTIQKIRVHSQDAGIIVATRNKQ